MREAPPDKCEDALYPQNGPLGFPKPLPGNTPLLLDLFFLKTY